MKRFTLALLARILELKIKNPINGSYTARLAENSPLLYKKIREEARELTKARNKAQVTWEAADLFYFVLVLLAKRGVTIQDVESMLERRNKAKA